MGRLLSYFSFVGRANRQRYWLASLALYGVLIGGVAVGLLVPGVKPVLAAVVFIVAMWGGLAVSARRLHDRNKSAWWSLLPVLAGVLVRAGHEVALSSPQASLALFALSLPLSIWAVVELGILKGTTGPNRFGADPLQPTPAEVFS